MTLFQRITALLNLMLVGLTSAFGFASSGPKTASGDFFSEIPNCARPIDAAAQYLCRVNGWLQYDSTSGYVVAANRGDDAFRLFSRHGDVPSPRPQGMQSHHGVNSVWVDNNYLGYVADDAPTILMRNAPNHNATRGVFNRMRAELARRQGVSTRNIDWSQVSPGEAWRLSEEMFDAADVPLLMRDDYFRLFNEHLDTLGPR